jgi:hypothetical protein
VSIIYEYAIDPELSGLSIEKGKELDENNLAPVNILSNYNSCNNIIIL